jgi:hypothetical protein
MDPIARRSAPATSRSPVFFRIAIGLFALLLVFGAVVTALLVYESKTIRSAGGWGYLVGIFVLAVAAFFSCMAGVVCTALSLWRGEPYRRLSIAILVVSAVVVWTLRGVPGALVRAFWAH